MIATSHSPLNNLLTGLVPDQLFIMIKTYVLHWLYVYPFQSGPFISPCSHHVYVFRIEISIHIFVSPNQNIKCQSVANTKQGDEEA